MQASKKLFLLDAMALIYRAYYALNKNPRINSKGVNTSAVLGFTNTLYEVIKKEQPTHIAVAFDLQAPTVRHEEYLEYKANRQATPEDITISLPYIKKIIEAFNIPILICEGYEADDIIGTIAKKAEQKGFFTYMMTSDKDFGQLVSENIFIYKPAKMGDKAEVIGVAEVCKKYNIKRAEQLVEILGLWGDASDNIPGIPGIGEVTAKKLIGEFGTIENLINNHDKLTGKLRESVEKYSHQAIMSKQLATIILDVPVEFHEEALRMKDPNQVALKQLFDELEFRTIAKRIFADLSLKETPQKTEEPVSQDLFSYKTEVQAPASETPGTSVNTIETTKHNYMLADSKEKRNELIHKLLQQKTICFDTETTGIDPNSSELVGISFSFNPHEAYYVNIPENYHEAQQVVEEFRAVFENPGIEKAGQNLKFDISILKWYDIKVKGKMFDTMLAHYLIEPDNRHNLDFLAATYLNYRPVPIESLIGKKGPEQMNMRTVPLNVVTDYSCEDADVTFQLKNIFEPVLQETGVAKLFSEIEIPLIAVLASMETEGINIDVKILNEYSVELQEEISRIEKEIIHLAGVEFNVASPKQLGEVLFDHLKIIEKPKFTKTKQYSTSEDTLMKLSGKHPVIPKILDYRSLAKLKSTYVDALPALMNPRTQRVHTSYNQAIAATGRLSSSNPNLQNIPIRTEKGKEIRKAFVPRNSNYILLSADYSQIELRIIAELSKDRSMTADFNKGMDIHTATAAKVFNVKNEDVSKDMRRKAKEINFGIIYGISGFGLSQRLNIPKREAQEIIEQYFANYPEVKKYIDNAVELAKQNGYVETIMGRRRYLRDINSNNSIVRGHAERNAVNAPIQGSAADIIKIAMINIYNEFCRHNLKSRMLLQVHDELVFDVLKEELELVRSIVKDKMVNAVKMNVPLEVEINTGNNWLEAH